MPIRAKAANAITARIVGNSPLGQPRSQSEIEPNLSCFQDHGPRPDHLTIGGRAIVGVSYAFIPHVRHRPSTRQPMLADGAREHLVPVMLSAWHFYADREAVPRPHTQHSYAAIDGGGGEIRLRSGS